MYVMLAISIIFATILVTEIIKQLAIYLWSKFGLDIYDISSIGALVLCEIMVVTALCMKKEWSIDNVIVLLIVALLLLFHVLSKNIRSSTMAYGILATLIQALIGIVVIGIICLIISLISDIRKDKNKE